MYKIDKKHNPFATKGVGGVVFGTPTAEAGNARTINVQVNDDQGRPVSAPTLVTLWLSDAATGIGVVSSAASTGMTDGGDGALMVTMVTGKMYVFQTDATGSIDVTITDTAVRTVYLAAETMDGVAVSGAIAFA